MLKKQLTVGLLALSVFLFFVNFCIGKVDDKTVIIYKGETTASQNKEYTGIMTLQQPYWFRIPAFVGGLFKNKEFLAVISGLGLWSTPNSSSIDGVVKTSYGEHKTWTAAKSFTNNSEVIARKKVVGDFTAIMNGNKIYVLVTGHENTSNVTKVNLFDDGWEPLMFVGTVEDSTNTDTGGASIKWETGNSLKDKIKGTVTGAQKTKFLGGSGNGIVTKNNTIVFPILIRHEEKFTSSIMYSTDNGLSWHLGGLTEFGTYDSSVVEWGEGKLLLTAPSTAGHRKVFESNDLGATWKESLVLSRVWGNDPNRSTNGIQGSAIKVPVDGGEMLLFSHTLNTKQKVPFNILQLWLSDGKRIVCVGTISDEEKEKSSGHSILVHVGSHLYVTHEINPIIPLNENNAQLQEWGMVIGFTPLPDFFESAKTTVRAWRTLDAEYKTKGVPTDGLVGFLGNSKDKFVWTDMYNCVNATVKGGKNVIGGFQFNGEAESGAQWPVARQGQNQVYIFTEKQFTLSATVIIHTTKETGEFSLIGATVDSEENNVLLGLGYTHDNKWIVVSDDNNKIKTTEAFTRNKEYHVALTFVNGSASVYVEGVDITNKRLKISQTPLISHFYMGAMQNSTTEMGSSCTVKNVMLFNKALGANTISAFFQTVKDKNFNTPTLKANPAIVRKNGETLSEEELRKSAGDMKQKMTKGDSSVMVASSAVCFMGFVCSFILLIGA